MEKALDLIMEVTDVMDTPVQEIVRLGIEVMREGTVFYKEFMFFANHNVYSRVTRLDHDLQESRVVQELNWNDLGQVRELVARMTAKGWEATWNPAFDERKEFFKMVAW